MKSVSAHVTRRTTKIHRQVLLVEPDFPYPAKSKNRANDHHRNFVPIGLLKLGAFYRSDGAHVRLTRGNHPLEDFGSFKPSLILVTSLFTYWSQYVWSAIAHYRAAFPDAEIWLGGIYATLHRTKAYFKTRLEQYGVHCHTGLHSGAENFYPDYSLLSGNVTHHVTHAMRGCIRRCSFCGVWKIEPDIRYKTREDILREIHTISKNKVIFFDNNFLANRHIHDILEGLADLRVNAKPVTFECQSGLDGRLLEIDPELGALLRRARFRNIRIAWDNSLSDHQSISRQLSCLTDAGYRMRDISVFMIYNYDTPYNTMLRKLDYCGQWGVQVSDCRYRPLDCLFDHYDPAKYRTGQTGEDYHIHDVAGWTDAFVRDFRKRVRQHNIWVRYGRTRGLRYDYRMEKWSRIHTTFKFFKMGRPPKLDLIESSPTWQHRIQSLNRIKDYYQERSMNSLDFSALSKPKLDAKIQRILHRVQLALGATKP